MGGNLREQLWRDRGVVGERNLSGTGYCLGETIILETSGECAVFQHPSGPVSIPVRENLYSFIQVSLRQ